MSLLKTIKQKTYRLLKGKLRFENTEQYWEERYHRGYDSGAGSYGELAQWKAQTINAFISSNNIQSVIDFGCGDGNIASLIQVPSYLGLDISQTAIDLCSNRFRDDTSKAFLLRKNYGEQSAELALSLDVIFHIISDDDFDAYMETLFSASSGFVMIYSSNHKQEELQVSPHFKHRKFTDWVKERHVNFSLVEHIPNAFQFDGDEQNSSCSDFYIYQRIN
ncbi:MAG: class I SAM-dependent methyltransferase [Bacteroidota bacterium]